MDEYTKLKNEIDNYLNREELTTNSDIISAYDLARIVSEKISKLKEIRDGKVLAERINQDNKSQKTSNIFKKTIFDQYCSLAYSSNDGKTSSIYFKFSKNKKSKDHYAFTIYKDKDDVEIYFKDKDIPKEFIIYHQDIINETFADIEYFAELYQKRLDWLSQKEILKFSDDFFDTTLSYDAMGTVKISIKVNSEKNQNGVVDRNWLNRNSLSDYIEANKDEFLKRIPINISELNHTTKTIVEEYLGKLNAPLLVKRK